MWELGRHAILANATGRHAARLCTFMRLLNADKFPLEESRCVHEQITISGWDSGVFVGSSLLDMYANCGCIKDACKVFNKMPSRHVVTWTAMILGCVKRSQGQKALELF
jgi:pentatricopeptide repeat protein